MLQYLIPLVQAQSTPADQIADETASLITTIFSGLSLFVDKHASLLITIAIFGGLALFFFGWITRGKR